jgi:CheY-like chemotaxis protein
MLIHFSEITRQDTGMKTKQLHVRVSEGVYKKLKVKCVSEDTSMQGYVAKLIGQSLGEYPAEEEVVLIVDDEAILRESLSDYLKETYRVVTAGTGEEALALIEKHDFDVLVIDVRLPGKTGLQVLREMRESKPYIRSIVMTAYPSAESAVEAMKLGAVDYLAKPIGPDDLETLIRETLLKKGRRGH